MYSTSKQERRGDIGNVSVSCAYGDGAASLLPLRCYAREDRPRTTHTSYLHLVCFSQNTSIHTGHIFQKGQPRQHTQRAQRRQEAAAAPCCCKCRKKLSGMRSRAVMVLILWCDSCLSLSYIYEAYAKFFENRETCRERERNLTMIRCEWYV